MNDEITRLIIAARRQMPVPSPDNHFLELLEAGQLPRETLGVLAGELYRLVRSDRRSFALLASRFPSPPAGDFFLATARGEGQALRLLLGFAAVLGIDEDRLAAYEPTPLAQAYPAYLTQTALFGSRSDMALALLANVEESGRQYARVAEALQSQYGFSKMAVEHFLFFADTPQDLLDQGVATLKEGLFKGDNPLDAVRTARMVHAYETVFWSSLSADVGPV